MIGIIKISSVEFHDLYHEIQRTLHFGVREQIAKKLEIHRQKKKQKESQAKPVDYERRDHTYRELITLLRLLPRQRLFPRKSGKPFRYFEISCSLCDRGCFKSRSSFSANRAAISWKSRRIQLQGTGIVTEPIKRTRSKSGH